MHNLKVALTLLQDLMEMASHSEKRTAERSHFLAECAMQVRAPAARIILIGYLPAIPAIGAVCAAFPLTADDATTVRSVAVRLAQTIGGAASQAGISVIRASPIGRQHDACSPDPYIAGAHPARNAGWAAPVSYYSTSKT